MTNARVGRSSSSCWIRMLSFLCCLPSLAVALILVADDTNDLPFQPLDYLPNPELVWQRRLDGDPSRGNGVVLSSHLDVGGPLLYVTASDGSLSVLNPENGGILAVYRPPSNPQGWAVSCTTSLDLYQSENDEGESYLVYVVTDTAPEGSPASFRKESRVIALTHNRTALEQDPLAWEATPRWISDPLEGVVSGTPKISSDGQYVFLTRVSELLPTPAPTRLPSNAPSPSPSEMPSVSVAPTDMPTGMPTASPAPTGPTARRHHRLGRNTMQMDTGEVTGYFTILSDAQNGGVLFQEDSTQVPGLTNPYYGPIAIAKQVTGGNYGNQQANTNDIVMWGLQTDPDAMIFEGETQLFQFPINFNGNAAQLSTVQLGTTDWTTQTAPAMRQDGQAVFFGTSENVVNGWNEGQRLDLASNYLLSLEGTSEEAPPHRPVLSVDETLAFVPSALEIPGFQAISVTGTAAVAWSATDVPVQGVGTPAVPSPDHLRVYYAAGEALFAKLVADGTNPWSDDSYIFDAPFLRPIQAEFTLSYDGRILYYGGYRANRVAALRLANEPNVTSAPSAAPSTSAPTLSAAPSLSSAPSISQSPTLAPTIQASQAPTNPMPNPTPAPTPGPTPMPVPITRRPTPTAAPTDPSSGSSGPSTGVIVGAAVGGAVGLLLIGYLLYAFVLKGGGSSRGGGGGTSSGASNAASAYTAPAASGGAGGTSSGRRSYGGEPPSSSSTPPRRPYPPPAAAAPPQQQGGPGGTGGPRRPYPPPSAASGGPVYGQQTSEVPSWVK